MTPLPFMTRWHVKTVKGSSGAAKLERNKVRDRVVTRALRKAGWTVVRVWECDLARKHWARVARRLGRALGRSL